MRKNSQLNTLNTLKAMEMKMNEINFIHKCMDMQYVGERYNLCSIALFFSNDIFVAYSSMGVISSPPGHVEADGVLPHPNFLWVVLIHGRIRAMWVCAMTLVRLR